MAYDITLEGKNGKQAERLLAQVTTILDDLGLPYWLEGGTLLGIIREGRLLPWDNDVDISMHVNHLTHPENLFEALKNIGLRVRTRYFKESSEILKKGNIRMIKVRQRRFFGLLKGTVCLDIFVKYTRGDHTFWEIDNKQKQVPYHFYETLDTLEFKDKTYSIPKDAEGYLTYRYGDWKIPVKDWDTSTDDKALS